MGYELGLLVAALIVMVGVGTILMALWRRPKSVANVDGAQTSAVLGPSHGAGGRASKVAGTLLILIGVLLAVAMIFWDMDFMLAVALPAGLLVIPFMIILLVRWIRMQVTSD